MKITGHMMVLNEDRFVKLAIESVLPFLDKLIIYDTGSTDKTVTEIEQAADPGKKIIFEEKGPRPPAELTQLRNDMIARTTTPFFMLVDGDEIWPKDNLLKLLAKVKKLPEEKYAVFCRTRNCVGDVYHYLPDIVGDYRLAGMKGHLNIRVFRNLPGLKVVGDYPLEAFYYNGRPVNDQPKRLQFVNTWYLHATHLKRSSTVSNKKFKYDLGLPMNPGLKLPKRSPGYVLRAVLEMPLKLVKRRIA